MEMTFGFGGVDTVCRCDGAGETFNDIFHKLRNDVDINSIIFLYSGLQMDGNISINKIINRTDLERKKMSIIVIDKEKEPEPVYIQSKDVICPKCGDCAQFDI